MDDDIVPFRVYSNNVNVLINIEPEPVTVGVAHDETSKHVYIDVILDHLDATTRLLLVNYMFLPVSDTKYISQIALADGIFYGHNNDEWIAFLYGIDPDNHYWHYANGALSPDPLTAANFGIASSAFSSNTASNKRVYFNEGIFRAGLVNIIFTAYGENSIAMGNQSRAEGLVSTIFGGENQLITSGGVASTIGGGNSNTVSGAQSVCMGGADNVVSSSYSIIAGGRNNDAIGQYSAVLGGFGNNVFAGLGGQGNGAASSNLILSGLANSATGVENIIGSGQDNSAGGSWSGILGGRNNGVTGEYSYIMNGRDCGLAGDNSIILNGLGNTAIGDSNFIGTGLTLGVTGNNNTIIDGYLCSVEGDNNVQLSNYNSNIIGDNNLSMYGYTKGIGGYQSCLAGGSAVSIAGIGSFILNGTNIAITGDYSTILGGTNNNLVGHYTTMYGYDLLSTAATNYSLVVGQTHFTNNVSNSVIIRSGNTVENSNGVLVTGINNNVSDSQYSWVMRNGESITDSQNSVSIDASVDMIRSSIVLNGDVTGATNSFINGSATNISDSFVWASGGVSNVSNSLIITTNGTTVDQLNIGVVLGNTHDVIGNERVVIMGNGLTVSSCTDSLFWNGTTASQTGSTSEAIGMFTEGAGDKYLWYSSDSTLGARVQSASSAWSAICASSEKTTIGQVENVLDKLEKIHVYEWEYKASPGTLYRGPVAQEWRAEFPHGHPHRLDTLEMDAVKLAGLRELIKMIKFKNTIQ